MKQNGSCRTLFDLHQAMRRLRRTGYYILAVSLAFSLANEARADARKGELFGLRIGDQYPVSNATKLIDKTGERLVFRILAERAVKPDDLGSIYIYVTVRSYTIITIESELEGTKDSLKPLVDKYSRALRTKYPDARENVIVFEGITFSWDELGTGHPRLDVTVEPQEASWLARKLGRETYIFRITLDGFQALERLAKREQAEYLKEEARRTGRWKGL